ncbi:MAG: hypothetical protein AB1638_01885 [Nitrospirota bacterium]
MKKAVFWIIVIAILAYTGFKFGIPYYRYVALKSDAKEIARLPYENEERIKGQMFERAKQLKVPIKEEDIKVAIAEGTVTIRTSWSEMVDIFGIYRRNLRFTINIRE